MSDTNHGKRTIRRHMRLHRSPVGSLPVMRPSSRDRNVFAPNTCYQCGGPRSAMSGRYCKACWDSQHLVKKRPYASYVPPEGGSQEVLTYICASQVAIDTAQKEDEEILPLALYRGSVSLGRIRALLNLSQVLAEEGLPTFSEAARIASLSRRAMHLMGLHHAPPHRISRNKDGTIHEDNPTLAAQLKTFFNRLANTPEILESRPTLRKYVEYLGDITPNAYYPLDRIERFSPWSSLPWRKIRTRGVSEQLADVPIYWPYVRAADTEETPERKLLEAVESVVPQSLPEQFRADVCQDLVVAILSQEASLDDLARSVPALIKKAFRDYPIKYGPLSLDAPAPWASAEGDLRTLGDMIAANPSSPFSAALGRAVA